MLSHTSLVFGIAGYPLGHSLSPVIHNWVYKEIGLNASYQAWATPPDSLENFVHNVRKTPLNGVSITIPHKQSIVQYIDKLTPLAAQVGAVNTLFWKDARLAGANTDVLGFMDPLKERGFRPTAVLVLGAGGASRAVLAGLCELPMRPQIFISARSMDKAIKISNDFGVRYLNWSERGKARVNLIVNTTPMGMKGGPAPEASPLCVEEFTAIGRGNESCLAYDLVYNPLETPFLTAAKAAAWKVQDGLDMLIAQGLEQIKLWTGIIELPAKSQIRNMLVEQGFVSFD